MKVDIIRKAAEGCQEDNWDGYNAAPITEDQILFAQEFFDCLPYYMANTVSAIPDPNGCVGFDWYFGKSLILGVEADAKDRRLYYAALISDYCTDGALVFTGEVPKTIVELYKKIESYTGP